MSTSLPLPSVSQVELLKLFGPERPELDLQHKSPVTMIGNLKYSLSSKIFLSPPPALCFTFSNDRILELTSQSNLSSRICNNVPHLVKFWCLQDFETFLSVYLDVSTSGLVAHVDCRSHLEQTIVTIQDWSTGGWQQVDT